MIRTVECPGPGGETSSDPLQGTSSQWTPLAAAKQHLQLERPEVFDRMNRTIANCKVSRGMRKSRLDSLGVFESEVNEVRSRTQVRVQMHQELSSVSMRLPSNQKVGSLASGLYH